MIRRVLALASAMFAFAPITAFAEPSMFDLQLASQYMKECRAGWNAENYISVAVNCAAAAERFDAIASDSTGQHYYQARAMETVLLSQAAVGEYNTDAKGKAANQCFTARRFSNEVLNSRTADKDDRSAAKRAISQCKAFGL
jgi:hypothetical protein